MPIPSDFPGMTSSQLDGFIADFLSAIYGEEVRDKFARIAYLIGHQLQEDAQASLDSAVASAQAAAASADEAETANQAAQAAKEDAQSSKTAAAASAGAAQESANAAADSETAAAGSATAAAESAQQAGINAEAAQESAAEAATWANSARISAENADDFRVEALTSMQNAAKSEAAAKASEQNAAKSETAAASSEQNAAQSADEAYTWNQNSLTLYHSTEELRDQTQAYYTEILQTELEHNVEILSQAAFDAITPAPNRLYIIDNGPNPYLRGLFPLKSDGKNVFDETQSATGVGKISYDGDSCTFGEEKTSLAELIGAGTYDLIIPPVVTSQGTVEDALTVEGKDLIVQNINSSFLLLPITNLGLEAGKSYQVHGQIDSTEGLDVSPAIVSLMKIMPQSVLDIMEQKTIASFTAGEYDGVFEAPSDLAEYQYLLFVNCGDNTVTIELNYAAQHTNYLTLPNNLFSGEDYSNGLTVSLEVCPAVYADWTRLFQFYAPPTETQTEGDLYATQGVTVTGFWNNTQIQQMGYANYRIITPDVWHQIAFVVSPSALMMYVDGQLVTTATDTGTTLSGILANLSSFTQNWIGNSRFEDDDFSGKIRNFRIFAKALSQEEVQQIGGEVTWKLYWGEKELDLHDLPLTGGTMEGPVDMDGHAITGLPDPEEDTDAVPKGWADGQYTPLTAAIRPTVTGNPIAVTDSAEAPVQELCVYGRTEQATTTGAQLFDAETALASKIEVGIVTVTDDGIVLNGTFNSSNRAFSITLDAGTYYFSESSNTLHKLLPQDSVWNDEITLEEQTTVQCYIASGNYTNKLITPMLNAGSTALPWEPYTGGKPSPSPEYPQELVSAGDDGQIDVTVCGANLFDASSVPVINLVPQAESIDIIDQTFSMTSNRTDFYIGSAINKGSNASGAAKAMAVKVDPLATYTFSVSDKNLTKNFVSFLDENYIAVAEVAAFNATSGTFTTPERCVYASIRFGDGNSVVGKTYSTTIMLNTGSTALPWEPYTGETLTLTGDLPGIPVDSGGNYTDPDGQQWVCDTIDVIAKQKIQRIGIIDSYNGESVGDVWMSTTGQLTTGAKVVYQLDEPITSQISVEVPTTYDGTTNVTATDGAGLSLRYVADTQKYIDNKIAALSAAMLEG